MAQSHMKETIENLKLEKCVGMVVGGPIGDALGMPAEGLTKDQKIKTYGAIQYYLKPKGIQN